MLVTTLGEFGLIKRISRRLALDSSVVKGSGDDCAVLKFDKDNYQLFTCDMIIEGEDFTVKDGPYLIGRKAIAVSLSDIAACCGKPLHCVVALGVPANTPVKFLDRLAGGMLDIARKYKVNIVGGDVSRASRITIDVAMLGRVKKKQLVLRSGAKPGDIIFVTGSLGGSILGKHLKFTPRLKESAFLAANYKINSMIDISDGLAQDLGHILEESGAGAAIYENLIPLSNDARGLSDALYSGEDFELLFTLSHKEAKRLLASGPSFTPIGEILDKRYGLKLIDRRDREINIKKKGFRHF